jgi:hypothetical protein
MVESFNDPAGIGDGASTSHRINWCDPHKSKLAHIEMPLNQLAGGVNRESSERKSC